MSFFRNVSPLQNTCYSFKKKKNYFSSRIFFRNMLPFYSEKKCYLIQIIYVFEIESKINSKIFAFWSSLFKSRVIFVCQKKNFSPQFCTNATFKMFNIQFPLRIRVNSNVVFFFFLNFLMSLFNESTTTYARFSLHPSFLNNVGTCHSINALGKIGSSQEINGNLDSFLYWI